MGKRITNDSRFDFINHRFDVATTMVNQPYRLRSVPESARKGIVAMDDILATPTDDLKASEPGFTFTPID